MFLASRVKPSIVIPPHSLGWVLAPPLDKVWTQVWIPVNASWANKCWRATVFCVRRDEICTKFADPFSVSRTQCCCAVLECFICLFFFRDSPSSQLHTLQWIFLFTHLGSRVASTGAQRGKSQTNDRHHRLSMKSTIKCLSSSYTRNGHMRKVTLF